MAARNTIPFLAVLAGGCFAAPKTEAVAEMSTTSGIDLSGSDEAPYVPTTAESSSEASSGVGDSGDAPGSSEGGVGSSDGAPAESSSDGGGETGWNEDDPPPGFPTMEPFGDDVREQDLVGTWTTPWDPSGVADVELVIAEDGAFVMHERAADCSDVGSASGTMWVSGSQLVMHFDAWDKPAPWDAEGEIGVAIDPPYRMRIGYIPMGGYLGLSAPQHFTAIHDWQGRGYVRLEAGSGATANWAAESELWAMPPGESGPMLIVRDHFDAHLGSNGNAQLVRAQTWWYPEQSGRPDDHDAGPWSDDTPGNVAGAATVIGVAHAYDAAGLLSFTADRSFKLGVASDCS